MSKENADVSRRGYARQHQGSHWGLELELRAGEAIESEPTLERIEVSDGTVGWNVVRGHDRTFLGDIIRLIRVRPGGRHRFSYYGRRASFYFGREFRTKVEATEYINGRD
jgi:hypothetical protein